MQMRMVPIQEGVTPDELAQLLMTGWIKVGRQMIKSEKKILDPSNPVPVGLIECDVWVQPEPKFPAELVARLLYDVRDPDKISQQLFGKPIDELFKPAGPPEEVLAGDDLPIQ